MKYLAAAVLQIALTLVGSTSSAEADKIETKYLMFRIPKVRFNDILQLKKPGGKLDFGNGLVLTHDDIEPIPDDQPKNFAYRITLKKPLEAPNVTIHPNCVLLFFEFKEKVTDKYLLDAINCRSSYVEIDRIKIKGDFHSTFAKDEHHFACAKISTVTEAPLVNGKKVPPNKTIWIEDFDAEKSINPVDGISDYFQTNENSK